MAAADGDDSLYPIAVLIDELRNEDVQVEPPGFRRDPSGAFSAASGPFPGPGRHRPAGRGPVAEDRHETAALIG